MKKIAVLTSGGDAPGMNAAIRAVVRKARHDGLEVMGVMKGYQGLIDNELIPLNSASVSGIIKEGGTFLKSARSPEFRTPEGRKRAHKYLLKHNVDALVVIGGDGTFTGANIFANEFGFPVIGIPGTIDNDLYGTDLTIGYDTALNTVMEAVDKIRDTATAHSRLFFIEVMGRDAGFLALNAGLAVGAEVVLLPEKETHFEEMTTFLQHQYDRSKDSNIVIVAEGEKMGNTFEIADRVSNAHPEYDVRVTVLGHLQRGGSPTVVDRVLASELGYAAVEALMNGETQKMVGKVNNEIALVELDKAINEDKEIDDRLVNMIEVLAG